ncbi:hypothetical protein BKD30_11480 [Tersicoccus phoenicis]|uniref:Uncharacterized protein n=1 Tax=Tersicoccus phoenicis TaxID=554083 RepID=A0A1R1L7M3_9MICC|nr:hypothetical protein [Tersicoccus phoenicis]OMH23541.1 hypothetical protein BKD30_11480 [Tersicoccus phoenicis]
MSAIDTSTLMTIRPAAPRSRTNLLARFVRPSAPKPATDRRERYLQNVETFRSTHDGTSPFSTGSTWPDFG